MTSSADQYAAFYSYVRSDDRNEGGRITALRERLSAEMEVQLGQDFRVFQDRKHILVGEQWDARIRTALKSTTLLIAVVTPAFLRSEACREEVKLFVDQERHLGRDDLIIPVLYVRTPNLDDTDDEIAQIISARQHVDWTEFRLEDLDSSMLRKAVSDLATQIIETLRRSSSVTNEEADGPTSPCIDLPESASYGLIESLAEAEEALPLFMESINSFTEELNRFSGIMESGKVEVDSAQRSSKPSAAALIAIRRVAKCLEDPVSAMEHLVVEYVHQLDRVGTGVAAMVRRVHEAEDQEEIEAAEQWVGALDTLATSSAESLGSLQELRQTLAGSYGLSSTLRPVLERMNRALAKMLPSSREFAQWRDDAGDALRKARNS